MFSYWPFSPASQNPVGRKTFPATAHNSTQQSCTADTEETWTRSGSSCQGKQQGRAGHLSSGLRVFQECSKEREEQLKPNKPSKPTAPPALSKPFLCYNFLFPVLFISCLIYHPLCWAKLKGYKNVVNPERLQHLPVGEWVGTNIKDIKMEAFRVLKNSLLKPGITLLGQMREMDLCVYFITAESF